MSKYVSDGIRLKNATQHAIKKEKEKQYQRDAYQLRKRAQVVGLELLGNGRHTKGTREKWLRELVALENEHKDK